MVSAIVMVSTVWSVYCLLFVYTRCPEAPIPWAREARAPHFYKWLGTGGTVSRRTANKKLTKLFWPSRKRSPKRLIVLLEPKSGGARPRKFFSGALRRIGTTPPLSLRTGAPHFQIRSGATDGAPRAQPLVKVGARAPCDPVPFGGRRHCLFFFRGMLSTAHGAENFAFADTKSTPLLHKFDFPSAQMFSEVNLLV